MIEKTPLIITTKEKIMRNKLKKKYAKMHEENFRVLLKDIKVNLSE